nr:hypothetical protein Iba_chr08aCG14000 [Ipomoea batatas]
MGSSQDSSKNKVDSNGGQKMGFHISIQEKSSALQFEAPSTGTDAHKVINKLQHIIKHEMREERWNEERASFPRTQRLLHQSMSETPSSGERRANQAIEVISVFGEGVFHVAGEEERKNMCRFGRKAERRSDFRGSERCVAASAPWPKKASALAIEKKDFSAYFSAQPAKLGGSEPIGDLG